MKKRVAQNLLATFLGALAGGIVVFWVLARMGNGPGSPTPSPSPASGEYGTAPPSVSPSPASPSPSTASSRVTAEKLKVAFTLPDGYRLASTLNTFDAARSSGSPRFTVTSATPAQEEEYVKLVRNLQQQAATEAPEFAPGRTITLARSAASEQTFAAQLAKQKSTSTTQSGLSVTRYQRVEGLYPYDVAFLTLKDGTFVSVAMSYASGGEKPFDEDAYQGVLRTVEAL
ncbi:MAG: hypothetical protein Q8R32_00100 [bacterium]|nr:hypothetical protein [bacterium]